MPVTPHQFSLIRIILGCYLCIHFAGLLLWAPELFSSQGMVADWSLNPTSSYFPNILYIFDSPIFTQVFVALLLVLAVMFTLGFKRQVVCILLWYGWACLFNRNVYMGNPGLPFIGLIFMSLAFLPGGEPWSRAKVNEKFIFPVKLHILLWVVMALGYTASGIHKLGSPSWVSGEALRFVLENPLARNTFLREFLLSMPWLLKAMTWGALALEVLYLPLFFFKRLRPLIWLGMVLMHIGIIMTIDFADLTVGVLMVHLLTFDSRWLKPKKRIDQGDQPILFFDGVCGLCNEFVDFLFAEDQGQVYQVAALQGETARKKLNPERISDLNTLVVIEDGVEKIKSDAVMSILNNIGGVWRLVSLLRVFPKSLRNTVYDLVASNRYSIFGKKETCRLPTSEERSRFLS